MTTGSTHPTWDRQPVSDGLPHGASVVVFRRGPAGVEVLLLHRAHSGAHYEGDWAWTPPAGAREPGESVDACARRELREETGLVLDVSLTDCGTAAWPVYVAEAPVGAAVTIDDGREHDRYQWVAAGAAPDRCRPEQVCRALKAAVRLIGGGAPRQTRNVDQVGTRGVGSAREAGRG